jgi:ABC-type multidrug transport system ATPase subunit
LVDAVQNFALVDSVSVPFGPGLNILTGTSGSGKSVLVRYISSPSKRGVVKSVTASFLFASHAREVVWDTTALFISETTHN